MGREDDVKKHLKEIKKRRANLNKVRESLSNSYEVQGIYHRIMSSQDIDSSQGVENE